MPLHSITLNGLERTLEDLGQRPTVADLVAALGLRTDRVALERNAEILPRAEWAQTPLEADDKIELVHLVGGGSFGA